MTTLDLSKYGLKETLGTKIVSKTTGFKVYELLNHPGYMASNYDLKRNKILPEGIISISHVYGSTTYQLFIAWEMMSSEKQLDWAVQMIKIQIFLITEFDE